MGTLTIQMSFTDAPGVGKHWMTVTGPVLTGRAPAAILDPNP